MSHVILRHLTLFAFNILRFLLEMKLMHVYWSHLEVFPHRFFKMLQLRLVHRIPLSVTVMLASLILPKKVFSVPFGIIGSSPGSFSLTLQGSGLPTGNIQLSVLEARPKTFALSYVKPVVNYNFPIVIQLLSLQKSSALTYEPLKINVASSNTTNINIPSVLTIAPDSTEILFYGKGLSTSMTTLTLSSPGYNSITAQMAPAPAFMSMQILTSYCLSLW